MYYSNISNVHYSYWVLRVQIMILPILSRPLTIISKLKLWHLYFWGPIYRPIGLFGGPPALL